MRERDEHAQDHGVDRATAGADDVGGRDRLAMARGGGVERAEPEAGEQVEDAFGHDADTGSVRYSPVRDGRNRIRERSQWTIRNELKEWRRARDSNPQGPRGPVTRLTRRPASPTIPAWGRAGRHEQLEVGTLMGSRVNLEGCVGVTVLDDLHQIPGQKRGNRSCLLVLIYMAKLVGKQAGGLIAATDEN